MSIVRAKTNAYGPATLDIQIEQGAGFSLQLDLMQNSAPWDLSNATFDAHFSTKWSPGAQCIDLVVSYAGSPNNRVVVSFPSAASLGLALPSPPQTLPKTSSDKAPRIFQLGGWIFSVKDGAAEPQRLFDGDVYLDRDPCLT